MPALLPAELPSRHAAISLLKQTLRSDRGQLGGTAHKCAHLDSRQLSLAAHRRLRLVSAGQANGVLLGVQGCTKEERNRMAVSRPEVGDFW